MAATEFELCGLHDRQVSGAWGVPLRMRPVYTRRHTPCAKPVVQKRTPVVQKTIVDSLHAASAARPSGILLQPMCSAHFFCAKVGGGLAIHNQNTTSQLASEQSRGRFAP